MDRGKDFLRSQVNNAVMQHKAFIEALEGHEQDAEDQRFRDLCTRHIAHMREHQRMLEDYQQAFGGEAGMAKKAMGTVMQAARNLADSARESDFLKLVGDIVMARQAEDTFKTFREAGKVLGDASLARIGEVAEEHHDAYVKEANRLCQQMFVEHVKDVEPGSIESSASTSTQTNTSIAEAGF